MKQKDYHIFKVRVFALIFGVIALIFTACQNANQTVSKPQNNTGAATVIFDVESVTLNYGTRNMEIRGRLRSNGATKPEKVWVWAYFFAPNSEYASGSWSGSPIELNNPFVSGNEAIVTVVGHFHWADNQYTPKSGYFARVNTSTLTGDLSIIPSEQRNKTSAGAYMVRIVK